MQSNPNDFQPNPLYLDLSSCAVQTPTLVAPPTFEYYPMESTHWDPDRREDWFDQMDDNEINQLTSYGNSFNNNLAQNTLTNQETQYYEQQEKITLDQALEQLRRPFPHGLTLNTQSLVENFKNDLERRDICIGNFCVVIMDRKPSSMPRILNYPVPWEMMRSKDSKKCYGIMDNWLKMSEEAKNMVEEFLKKKYRNISRPGYRNAANRKSPLTEQHTEILKKIFAETKYPKKELIRHLSTEWRVPQRSINYWFQTRRYEREKAKREDILSTFCKPEIQWEVPVAPSYTGYYYAPLPPMMQPVYPMYTYPPLPDYSPIPQMPCEIENHDISRELENPMNISLISVDKMWTLLDEQEKIDEKELKDPPKPNDHSYFSIEPERVEETEDKKPLDPIKKVSSRRKQPKMSNLESTKKIMKLLEKAKASIDLQENSGIV